MILSEGMYMINLIRICLTVKLFSIDSSSGFSSELSFGCKNKFKIFLGSDSKFLKFLYKINSIWAIRYINKKMSNIN